MRARPYAYVAQEHLALSQAPVWYTKSAEPLLGARARHPRLCDRDA